MKNLVNSLVLVLAAPFIISCGGNGNEVDTKAIKEEVESRKLKRLKPFQIIEEGYKKGRDLVLTLETGQPDSLDMDSLAQAYVADIRLVDLKDIPSEGISDVESDIYQAYRYSLSKKMSLVENVQMEDTFLLYTAPAAARDSSGIWSIKLSKRFLIMNMD